MLGRIVSCAMSVHAREREKETDSVALVNVGAEVEKVAQFDLGLLAKDVGIAGSSLAAGIVRRRGRLDVRLLLPRWPLLGLEGAQPLLDLALGPFELGELVAQALLLRLPGFFDALSC